MSSFKRASADAADFAIQSVPMFESLEERLLLSAPSFATPLGAQYTVITSTAGKALAIGIDGAADNGDALAITAVSDDPNLQAVVLPDTQFAKLHFVAADGTDIGDVLVELFDSRSATAAARFETLATTGYNSSNAVDPAADPFYTDVSVHRIIPNFMIQTGDAAKGDGTGASPLGAFTATPDANLSFSGAGVLAMANTGNVSSSDCQFFITDTATTWLNGNYLIFGQVISGMDIVDTLDNLPADANNRPLGVPILQSVSIIGSNQDGVVLLIPQAGFDGSATVSITLEDTVTNETTSQDISVVSSPSFLDPSAGTTGSMGTITMPQQEIFTPADSTPSFTPVISAPTGVTTMDVAVTSDKAGVTASIDPITYLVNVTVAADFTGAARLTVTAWPDGYDNLANWPVLEGVVYVNTAGQLSLDDPGLLKVSPGVEATVPATGSLPDGTTLNITSSLTGAVVSTDASFNVNITAPSSFTGIFQPKLTASQGTAITQEVGYVQAATQTLSVSSQNDDDPPVLQFTPQVSGGTGYATVIEGNLLYEANGAAGLSIYNIADPSAPALLYTYPTSGQVYDVKIIHRTISNNDHTIALLCDLGGGIISLDVTTPSSPTVLDTVAVDSSTGQYAVSIAVAGNVAYVAEYMGGLVAYDITDPANITKLGSFPASEILGVAIKGSYAFITDANNGSNDYDQWTGVIEVNVAKPAAMIYVNSFSTIATLGQWGAPWGLVVAGNYLYVADSNNGLLVYNVTNPAKTKYVSFLADSSALWQVNVANQIAVTSGNNSAKFINVANPAHMSVVYTYQTPDQLGLAGIGGTTLALPVTSVGVILMDASSLLKQTTVYSSATITTADGVLVTIKISKGGTVLVNTTGIGTGDITSIEVLNPTSKTAVTISTKSSAIASIGSVDIQGSVASFTAPTIDLAGDFVADGTVGSLKLHDVVGFDITLHDNAALAVNPLTQAAITLNRVANSQLDANDESIKSLTVTRWLDPDGPTDTITAPSLGSLSVTGNKTGVLGDFQADLSLSGSAAGLTLGKAAIAHNMIGSTWDLTGGVGTISVGGIVSDWSFDPDYTVTYVKSMTLGNVSDLPSSILVSDNGGIGSLTAGQWLGGTLFAGFLGTLKTGSKTLAGDISADVTLAGQATKVTIGHDLSGDWSALIIGSMTVKNDMSDAHLTLTLAADAAGKLWALGTLNISGSIDHSWISTAGNIKSITATRLMDSTIYAGVAAPHDTLPAPDGDGVFDLFDPAPAIETFNSPTYIKSLTVKGTKDGSFALQNSNIAAARLGTIKLANGQFDNDGTPFGLAAESITKFSYADAAMKYTWPNKDPNDATSPHLPAAFKDFTIRLV